MQNNNSKNQNTQLPAQVAAEINVFFDAFSFKEINGTLLEFVSAFTGPDPRSGKRHHIDICNTVSQIHKTLVFVRYCQENFPKIDQKLFGKNIGSNQVDKIAYIDLESYLFDALSNWIFQDREYSEPSLDYTQGLTSEFLKLSDWICALEILLSEGGLSW